MQVEDTYRKTEALTGLRRAVRASRAFAVALLLLLACWRAPAPLSSPTPLVTAGVTLPSPTALSTAAPTVTATPRLLFSTPTPTAPVRFAVIGDFGLAGPAAEAVAGLVAAWDPEFVVTVGDNNYPSGSELTFDQNVMAYYGDYVREERFFPALGNHDWGNYTVETLPFPTFFPYLPGNKRYYDLVTGPVHILVLDSDPREPDGVTPESKQGQWLREKLRTSTAAWQVVVFHHAPYSSGRHGNMEWMQWPFAEWGADLVLTGHDHTYERIHRDGIVYIVNGLGGAPRYDFRHQAEGSVVKYNEEHGALFIVATERDISATFLNVEGTLVDRFSFSRSFLPLVLAAAP